MDSPHYSVLLEVLNEEDLVRIRYRFRKVLKKRGLSDEQIESWIEVLSHEIYKREAQYQEEADARSEAFRQAG
jgi:hypothetical protein